MEIKKYSRKIYEGIIINVHLDNVLCKDKIEAKREWVEHPGGVAILPIVKKNHILLIEQYRYALKKYMWEIPAGKKEANEDVKTTALRELHEETGYSAKSYHALGKLSPTVGYSNEIIHLYVAWDLKKGTPKLDETENIHSKIMSFHQAFKMIDEGQIIDAKTIIALYKGWHWYQNKNHHTL